MAGAASLPDFSAPEMIYSMPTLRPTSLHLAAPFVLSRWVVQCFLILSTGKRGGVRK